MFGLGTGEIVLVLILALIFIGPERLPEVATKLGKWTREIKKSVDSLKNDFLDHDTK